MIIPTNLNEFKKHVLAVIGIMREEGVAVEPFTILPRRKISELESQLLLNYLQITPEIIRKKVLEERIHRLRAYYKAINVTRLRDPFIL